MSDAAPPGVLVCLLFVSWVRLVLGAGLRGCGKRGVLCSVLLVLGLVLAKGPGVGSTVSMLSVMWVWGLADLQ